MESTADSWPGKVGVNEYKSLLLMLLIAAALAGGIWAGYGIVERERAAAVARGESPYIRGPGDGITASGGGERWEVKVGDVALVVTGRRGEYQVYPQPMRPGPDAREKALVYAASRMAESEVYASRFGVTDEQVKQLRALGLPRSRALRPEDRVEVARLFGVYAEAAGPAKREAEDAVLRAIAAASDDPMTPEQAGEKAAAVRGILREDQVERVLRRVGG